MGGGITSDLTSFASGFFADPKVKEKCLELQDSRRANINVVIWLCWLDSNNIRLGSGALNHALEIVGGVNKELLRNLRLARKNLQKVTTFTKVQEQLIKKNILSAELAIEKVLLQRLQDLLSRLKKLEDESQEALSLFDYFSRIKVKKGAKVAAEVLEMSREWTQERESAVEV